MQVIHSVVASDEECQALFELAEFVGKLVNDKAYSEEEKVPLSEEAKMKFKATLAQYVHEAFTYGYNEGLNNANMRDTQMYRPNAPTTTYN